MLGRILGGWLAWNLGESIVDNVFRDKVTPLAGSIVYCDYRFGVAEHSGVYIGNNRIVQLSGSGKVEQVSPREFVKGTTAISIYVSCCEKEAVWDTQVCIRACSQVGNRRDYNFLTDNCHQFSAGCLTGDFEEQNNFLWMLKDLTTDVLGANTWRVWDLSSEELFG